MAEKEEEEIELPKIATFSDDVDFEDFHTPEAPVQRKRPLSLRFSPEESSTKREDSPRKRSSIPYHQRIAGGTRVNESKNVLDDLMKPNAGKMINLAAIEEGKEELNLLLLLLCHFYIFSKNSSSKFVFEIQSVSLSSYLL